MYKHTYILIESLVLFYNKSHTIFGKFIFYGKIKIFVIQTVYLMNNLLQALNNNL